MSYEWFHFTFSTALCEESSPGLCILAHTYLFYYSPSSRCEVVRFFFLIFLFFSFSCARDEARASYGLGKCCTIELHF